MIIKRKMMYKGEPESEIINGYRQGNKKLLMFYNVLVDWLYVKISGETIKKYFDDREYKKVAIYGMKELGDLLVKELQDEGMDVVCGIDRNAEYIIQNIPLIHPDEEIPDVDVIVVTAVSYYEEIKEEMSKKTDKPIVSLQEVISSIYSTII